MKLLLSKINVVSLNIIVIILFTFLFYNLPPIFSLQKSDFLEGLSFTVETKSNKKVETFRINSKGELIDVSESHGDIGKLYRGFVISISNSETLFLERIKMNIGNQSFDYSFSDLKKEWIPCNNVKKWESKIKENFICFKSPKSLSNNSFINHIYPKHILHGMNYEKNLFPALFKLILYIAGLYFWIYLIYSLFKEKLMTSNYSPIHYKNNYNIYLYSFLFSIPTLLLSLHFSRLGFDAHHSGIMLQSALVVSEGNMLFKEVYYHYGALTALFQAWSLSLFGHSLYVIHTLTSVFYFLISFFMGLILSRFFNLKLTSFILLLWPVMASFISETFLPWSSVYALCFMMIALYAGILFIENGKKRNLVITGSLIALSFWTRQTVGPLLGIAMAFVFILLSFQNKINMKSTMKNISFLIGGVLIISIPVFVWLAVNDAFFDWFRQNFTGQAEWAASGSPSILKFIKRLFACLLPHNIWGIFPILTLVSFFSLTKRLYSKKDLNISEQSLLLVSAVGISSWAQYFPVPGPRHFYWSAPPMIISSAVVLSQLYTDFVGTSILKRKWQLSLISLALFAIVIIGFKDKIWSAIQIGTEKSQAFIYEVNHPTVLSGMKMKKASDVKTLELIESYLTKARVARPSVSLISYDSMNMLFLAFVKNNMLPSPFPVSILVGKTHGKHYKYTQTVSNFVKKHAPIIYSNHPVNIPGYTKVSSFKFSSSLEYIGEIMYFYEKEVSSL
jgi:hypothetical protein